MRDDDVDAIAAMIHYPISLCLEGGGERSVRIIENAAKFKKNYPLIFHPAYKAEVFKIDNAEFFYN